MEEFKYKGYMCDDAENFFEGKVISEQRDGCAVVGHFVKLGNGNTHLPSKGEIFKKDQNGDISVTSIYR